MTLDVSNIEHPLILVTNDDGIQSRGLWAAAEALLPLGEVLVVAPDRQWSGAGRSMPHHVTGRVSSSRVDLAGQSVAAYAVDASPALCVVHGVLEFAPRRPDLVVSGINFGLNLGTEVTVSGTVGAALEGAAFDLPAMAVSLEMDPAYHLTGDENADYAGAMTMTHFFASRLLAGTLPYDVHALNVNIPRDATPETPWWLSTLSRRRYFLPLAPDRKNGHGRPGYTVIANPEEAEVDSDVWAVLVDRVISVTPLSLDLTSRVDLCRINHCLHGDECVDLFEVPPHWIDPGPEHRVHEYA
ncbi:MAG: 5'/3'-nucleotidase SurE [Anaerolineae bacterium]|nr:5'/3'-nucleotidase SurE [Anaerolineae bacterium]